MEPDFSGYATKAGLKCSDGRVITSSAFQHMDGQIVPLVWMHGHNEPTNILGHVKLSHREDGIYAQAFFNETTPAQHINTSVKHGDITAMSIYANSLREMNKVVSHGNIREVSLVLSGANPGAKIDQVRLQHGEGDDTYYEDLEEDAIISGMGTIEVSVRHSEGEATVPTEKIEKTEEPVVHAAGDASTESDETVEDIWNTLDEKQKSVVHYMIGAAIEETEAAAGAPAAAHSDNTEGGIAHQEGSEDMARNLFEQAGVAVTGADGNRKVISHSDVRAIFQDGQKRGSFREAANAWVEEQGLAHGITSIETLFPDATALSNTPEFDKRRTEWVSVVLNGTHHTPFAKIKTISADLTQDEARAKGYIKGNYKIEEWIGVTSRSTSPTTVYKKQKLDRDDILDITDFDVVAWLMGEMRLMLEEEIARAILIGDGRDPSSTDKIKDPLGASDGTGIRSILNEHELFATTVLVDLAGGDYETVVDGAMDGAEYYKGTGTPWFFTTVKRLNGFKKAKNANGDRYYKTTAEVAEALGVAGIVTVEPMNEIANLVGIIVNLQDYNVGTNRGGEITSFEDFDIDYNQNKYLLETRLSGALTKIKSAIIIKEKPANATLVAPVKPAFAKATGVITIPTVTGVVYKDGAGTTLTAGALTALPADGTTKTIYSVAATGYYFADTANDSWSFTRDRA